MFHGQHKRSNREISCETNPGKAFQPDAAAAASGRKRGKTQEASLLSLDWGSLNVEIDQPQACKDKEVSV